MAKRELHDQPKGGIFKRADGSYHDAEGRPIDAEVAKQRLEAHYKGTPKASPRPSTAPKAGGATGTTAEDDKS